MCIIMCTGCYGEHILTSLPIANQILHILWDYKGIENCQKNLTANFVCANFLTLLPVNPPTNRYGICCLALPGLHKKHYADLFFLRLHQRLYRDVV